MRTKIFKVVTSVSMVLTITAAVLSVISIAFYGFYPGIIVLLLLSLIPIASKFYANKNLNKPVYSQNRYYSRVTIINLFVILVVLWMTFVIMHDRVLQDC